MRKMSGKDFLGGPVAKLHTSSAGGEVFIPGQGAKIPHPICHMAPSKERVFVWFFLFKKKKGH